MTGEHTRTEIAGMDYICAERDCGHVQIGEGYCPITIWDACAECSARSWDEHEGPIVTWDECDGTGAIWDEFDS